MASCVVPGVQPVLFHVPSGAIPTFMVIDRAGHEQVRTTSLGVALSAARQVLAEQGEVWVRASDGTCAHIDPERVGSDTPSCPWIQSLAASLEATP
jgi:hypothetical protein